MAKLINGNGNPAIYAAEDADLIASLAGNVTCIANVGNKYAATEEDATTIRLDDGVIITKEGRRIQLEAGESDTFYIPTGTSGVTNYYIIGYKLVQNSDSTQIAEQFVQKMNSSSETITEDTFRGGATEVYVSLYRVTQVSFTISSITGLLPELLDSNSAKDDIAQINSDLGSKSSASAVTGNDAFSKIAQLNSAKQDKLTNPLTRSNIVDNLSSSSTNNVLSANQGKVLNDNFNKKFRFNQNVPPSGNIVLENVYENSTYLITCIESSNASAVNATMKLFCCEYGNAVMLDTWHENGGIYLNWSYDKTNHTLTLVNMHNLVINLSVTQL